MLSFSHTCVWSKMLSATCRRALRAASVPRWGGGLLVRPLVGARGLPLGFVRHSNKSTAAATDSSDDDKYAGLAVKPGCLRNIAIIAHVGELSSASSCSAVSGPYEYCGCKRESTVLVRCGKVGVEMYSRLCHVPLTVQIVLNVSVLN